MRIYITGTTRGLGEALARAFEREFIFGAIIGLNRPDYDLSKDLDAYVKTDFDIYINNAQHGFSQTELLYKLFAANKDRKCTIINIGSVSADGDRPFVNPYAIQKKALDATCTQLQLVESECKVIQVKLGRMDTDLVSHIDAPKMSVNIVARYITDIYNMSINNSYIKTITIDIKQ